MTEDNECGFCGQDHGPVETVRLAGMDWPVRWCPNLPETWMGMKDAEDDTMFIVHADQQDDL